MRMEERNLEQAVTLGCDPAVLHAGPVRADKSKPDDTKKKKRIDRKATLGDQQLKAKADDAARIVKPNKTTRSAANTKTIDQCPLVKAKKARKNARAKKTRTLEEIISSIEAKLREHGLQPVMGVPADSDASHQLHSIIDGNTRCESEGSLPDTTLALKEVIAPAKEPEITADIVEMVQATRPRWETVVHWLAVAWSWGRRQLGPQQARKRLRVCESVSLGEKRFVAVIEVDGEQILVGGASSSVATLARLEPSHEFSEVLKRRWSQDPVQA
jgi:Flagellar biosynthesis protein, FliO